MTKNRALKRRVRARARRTGESYTAALQHFRPIESTAPPMPIDSTGIQVRLAVAQTGLRRDHSDEQAFAAAGDEVRTLMHRASTAGADIVQFPEATLCFPDKQALSRDADDLTEADWQRFAWDALDREIDSIRDTARSLRLWTVLGAQHREPTAPAGNRPTTSLLIIDPTGDIAARYDERVLSRSKQAYLYAPGSAAAVIDIDGFRIGFTSGLEVLFPNLFSDYEADDVDCVLFSTAGPAEPAEADTLASSACTHALHNGIWIGYAVTSDKAPFAPSGVIKPDGTWATRCPIETRPGIAVADLTKRTDHPGRTWRRTMLASLPRG